MCITTVLLLEETTSASGRKNLFAIKFWCRFCHLVRYVDIFSSNIGLVHLLVQLCGNTFWEARIEIHLEPLSVYPEDDEEFATRSFGEIFVHKSSSWSREEGRGSKGTCLPFSKDKATAYISYVFPPYSSCLIRLYSRYPTHFSLVFLFFAALRLCLCCECHSKYRLFLKMFFIHARYFK